MAISRVDLDNDWCNLIAQENQYYRATAKYLLHQKGIYRPTENQLQEKINNLFHFHLSFSIRFAKPLSAREVESLYQASCGEELKGSASVINRSADVIKRHRMSAFKKLQAKNIAQAIYRATQLGYLPLKEEKQISEQSLKTQELENAPC